MDNKAFKALAASEPRLWLDYLRMSGKDVNVDLIAAGENPAYEHLCKALQLPNRPKLFVYDGKPLTMPQGAFGFFSPLSGAVFISRQSYDDFLQQDPKGNYVAAHELGHAKSHLSRRKFIQAFAGATTYLGTSLAMDEWSRSIQHKWQKRRGEPLTDEIPMSLEINGMVMGGIAAAIVHGAFTRAEELRADQYALEALPRDEVIKGLAQLMEKNLTSPKQLRKLHKIKEQFAREKAEKEYDPATLDLAWALALGEAYKPLPIPMRALWAGYPTIGERMQQVNTGR